MRYEHERHYEHQNNHHDDDDDNNEADDEVEAPQYAMSHPRFVRNDDYNENNNMNREGNSESESADAELEEEETNNDDIEETRHHHYSPHGGRDYQVDDNTAEYMGRSRNSESESADSDLDEEEGEAADNDNDNIEKTRNENKYAREQEYRMGREDSGLEDSELEEEASDAREHEDSNDDNSAENVAQEEDSSSDKDNNDRMEISPRQKMMQEKEPRSQTIIANTDEEKEPPRIFHILETRFMQNQPGLVQLAKARLQLFKAICLPTVVQQTAWGNFMWIIRTDPELHIDIRRELVEMLNESGALTTKTNGADGIGERALTYVIGSNDNYIVANSTIVNPQIRPFDVHDMFSKMLSKPDKIFAGKVENIKSTLDELSSAAKDVVLWTRLDADDGLAVEFLKYIQEHNIRYFVPEKAKEDNVVDEKEEEEEEEEKSDFWPSNSEDRDTTTDVKEQPEGSEDGSDDGHDNEELSKLKNEPVIGNEADNEKDAEKGKEGNDDESLPYSPPNWMYWCGGQNIDWFLTDPIHDPSHETGVVYPVLHENVCVTPGITIAISGSIQPALVPKLDHDKIISYLSDAGGQACNRTGLQDDDEVRDDGSCFHMIHGWTHAVRSRTPTSAGMMGVNPDENQLKMVKRSKNVKKLMWRQLHEDFLLKDDDLRKTNSYFAKHVYDIAEENASGQCTNGHSCKVRCVSA